ncbi:uncharacterized protein LOC135823161 [Sycon ciliatum]|uniref:uncharacterized protein LOC135823161 n=1 Tax=Sycon ciliatum TaxID=27933 RepID=UPI0020AE105A|eukprot:scpid74309/ scgid25607/ 
MMEFRGLLVLLLVSAIGPRRGDAFLDVLLKDDMVQLFLGTSTPFYLVEQGYDSQLARSGILQYLDPLQPERSQLTFEWSSKKPIHYVIQLNSGHTGVMDSPRADISLRGIVPKVETEFHINFPCTFRQSGTTFVAITFTFFDDRGMPMYEMPFTLAMKRACVKANKKAEVHTHRLDISNINDDEKEHINTQLGNDLGDPGKERTIPVAVVVQPHRPVRPAEQPTPPEIETEPKDDFGKAATEAPKAKPAPIVKTVRARPTPKQPRPQIDACPMCIMPKNQSQLEDLICKAGFAIRTRLSSLGKDTKTNHFFLGLRDYRELRPSRRSASNALYAWERQRQGVDASEKATLTSSEPMRVRVMVGSRGACSCNGRVNNRDLYLVAGKYSSRRGQLVIRQTKSLLLPWREVKHWIRRLKPFRCSK